MERIFTFWEGPMPAYIELCIETWHGPYTQTFLNYQNLHLFTDIGKTTLEKLKDYTLPQIADYIRVHVLRDNGGYWLDTDTIMLDGTLPETDMIGNSQSRTNTIGYLHTEKNSEMYQEWCKYQEKVLANPNSPHTWDIMGNAFTDNYVREHEEITIYPVALAWAETYKIQGTTPRQEKYRQFYFECDYKLNELLPTNMLMLHNSWTPDWYKKLSHEQVLADDCTMSNILRELV